MLTWVTACIRSWGAETGPISSDFVELYRSAAALLVTLIAEEGAYYVPVLASSYYSDHVKTLCDALGKYEIHLNSLNVQSGIQAVLQSVGSALEGATVDSIAPLQTELDQIDKNIDNLLSDIRILNRQFHSQQVESDRNLKILTAEIIKDKIFQQMMTTLMASFEIIMAVGTAGAALSTLSKNPAAKLLQGRKSLDYFQMTDILGNKVSPVPALKNAFEGVGNGVKGGLKIYDSATKDDATPDKELLNRALSLMRMQEQSLAAFVTGALLVSGPAEGAESTLPEISASDRADPSLAWDNLCLLSRICGWIPVPGAVRACDTELFP